MIAHRPCPICGCREAQFLHRQDFMQPAGCPLPDAYDVVACPDCGFVYADTPASQQTYDRYYEAYSKYEDPAVASGGGIGTLDARRLEETAAFIAGKLATDARILDVGCAGGGLLAALRRRGFTRLCGVDAASGCIAGLTVLGIDAKCLPLSRLRELAEKGPFDAIVLSHVLEHVADLRTLMLQVSDLAAPGGNVYLETPNAARYADYPYVPYYFFDSEHINHFDPRQLAVLGARFGFSEDATGERVLEVAPGKLYPAAWAWLRKDAAGVPVGPSAANTELVAAVRRYVTNCKAAPAYPALRRLSGENMPIIVWGAGSFAQRLFGLGALDNCRIVAIVDRDRNKQGLSFGGRNVEAPETALANHPDATILILAAVHGEDIAREIRALNRNTRIEILDAPSPELPKDQSIR